MFVDRAAFAEVESVFVSILGLSESQWTITIAAFVLGYVALPIFFGLVTDEIGGRRGLTFYVTAWSLFVGLAIFASSFVSLVVASFLVGAGQAGMNPSLARVMYSWMPLSERGIAAGIIFSGPRIGCLIALPLVPILIGYAKLPMAFVVLMIFGFVWAVFWWNWFKSEPEQHQGVGRDELKLIKYGRVVGELADTGQMSASELWSKPGIWLLCLQFFASQFAVCFCLLWVYPYLRQTFVLDPTIGVAHVVFPLIAGAVGSIVSGAIVDLLYRTPWTSWSRRLPAIVGFVIASFAMVQAGGESTPTNAILWISLAVFGLDMTLAPSWCYCIDISRSNTGLVGGIKQTFGSLGMFLAAVVYPWWMDKVTIRQCFFAGAAMCMIAAMAWLLCKSKHNLEGRAPVIDL